MPHYPHDDGAQSHLRLLSEPQRFDVSAHPPFLPPSAWNKFNYGKRAYYQNSDTNAVSLQPPGEGVMQEVWVKKADAEIFVENWTIAATADADAAPPPQTPTPPPPPQTPTPPPPPLQEQPGEPQGGPHRALKNKKKRRPRPSVLGETDLVEWVKVWMDEPHEMTHGAWKNPPDLLPRFCSVDGTMKEYTGATVGNLLITAWNDPWVQQHGTGYQNRATTVLKKYMETASPATSGVEPGSVKLSRPGAADRAILKKDLMKAWIVRQRQADGIEDEMSIPRSFLKYALGENFASQMISGDVKDLYQFLGTEAHHLMRNISKTFASTLTDVIKEMAKDLAEGFLEGNMDIPTANTPIEQMTAMNFDPTAAESALATCSANVIQAVALLVANAQVAAFKNKMMLAFSDKLEQDEMDMLTRIIEAIISGTLLKLIYRPGLESRVSDVLESFDLDRYKVEAIGLLLKGDIDAISKNPVYRTFNYFRHLNFDPLNPLSSIKASWGHIRQQTVEAICKKINSRSEKSARIFKVVSHRLRANNFHVDEDALKYIVREMMKKSMEEPGRIALKGFLQTAKAIGASIPGIATLTSILSSSGDFLMKLYFEAVDMISEIKMAALDFRTKVIEFKTQKLEETVRVIKDHLAISPTESGVEDGQTQEMEDEAVGEVEAEETRAADDDELMKETETENAAEQQAQKDYLDQYNVLKGDISSEEIEAREREILARASPRKRRPAVPNIFDDQEPDALAGVPGVAVSGSGVSRSGSKLAIGGARNKISKKRKTIRRGKPKMRKTIRRKKSKKRKTIRRKKSKMKIKKRKTMRRKR